MKREMSWDEFAVIRCDGTRAEIRCDKMLWKERWVEMECDETRGEMR